MIPVALCIDVEPDEHVFAPSEPSPWHGFERLLREFPRLRERLAAATGGPVHFGWSSRIDPQIKLGYGSPTYLVENYKSQLDKLGAEGDGLGVHPHAWRWDPERQVTVADHGNSDFAQECAGTAVDLFFQVFGRLPDYHRYGGQYMSTATMNLLDRMGVLVDLTVEPGEPPDRDANLHGSVWTGTTGDFRAAPRFAYQPSRDDYLRPAPVAERVGGLWELPLTSGGLRRLPGRERDLRSLVMHPARTTKRLIRRINQAPARPPTGPAHRLLAMWLDWTVPSDFWDAAFEATSQLEKPYMAFAVRTDTGCDPDLHDRFGGIMEALLADPRAREVRFVTPAEALEMVAPEPTRLAG